jgi:two-component system cell cycle response regulator
MQRMTTRILLIEDDVSDHLLLRRSLLNCRTPSELTWCDRLATGIDALASMPFDVVFTDLSLPDAQGLDAVRQLRVCDSATPIVVLTTLDDPEVELKAIECGAQDYLVKGETAPFTLELRRRRHPSGKAT